MLAPAIAVLAMVGVGLLAFAGFASDQMTGLLLTAAVALLIVAGVLFIMLSFRFATQTVAGGLRRRGAERTRLMATQIRRRERTGGFTVLWYTLPEAITWAFVAHVIYNRWHAILPTEGWDYGYSVVGLVTWVIDQTVVPAEWVPLLVLGLAVLALVLLAFKFMPLIQGALHRPGWSVLIALISFAATLGAFEAVYYGMTGGELYWSWNLILNSVPPIVVATIILAGRGSRVHLRETGARDVDLVAQDDDQVVEH